MADTAEELFIKDQKPLRQRLIRIIKHSCQPIKGVSNEIGINRNTIMSFLHGKDTTFTCVNKIELYVDKYEKILDLI